MPVPTIAYLAQFTGRDEASFSAFADQALAQATLIFSTVTRREEYPDDPDARQLAINAILQLADRIYLEQPYAQTKASPYAAETIGSYSYSKGSTAYLATRNRPGELTGLFWWDLAVEELSLVDRSLVTSDALQVFQADVYDETATGRRYIIGPAEHVMPELPYDVNAEKSPRDPIP